MIQINKRNTAKCILLSIITLGIYGIYWLYLLVKNIRSIQKNTASCTGEMLCLIFVPFYSLYWWYTKGEITKQEFNQYNYASIGNGIIYLIFAILGLNIVSMAIMQSDFNSLKSETLTEPQNVIFKFKYIIIAALAFFSMISLLCMSIVSISIPNYGIDLGFSLGDLLDLPGEAEVGVTVAFTFITIIITVIIGVLAIIRGNKIPVIAASVAGILASFISILSTPESTSGGAGLWVALICCIITTVLSAVEIPVLSNTIDQYIKR